MDEIDPSTQFVTKMKQDVRTTFTDKISNIGKNFTTHFSSNTYCVYTF